MSERVIGLPKDVVGVNPYTGIVFIGDNRIAKGSNDPNSKKMPLTSVVNGYGLDISYRREKFSVNEIYLRTISDEIYRIKYSKTGAEITDTEIGETYKMENPSNNDSWGVSIGAPFCCRRFSFISGNSDILRTTKVVEMVAVSGEERPKDTLQHMSQHWQSSIVTDFQGKLGIRAL